VMITRALLALGLCALLSGCLLLNSIDAVDKAERFDAKAADGLILVGLVRDPSFVSSFRAPRGWDDTLLLTEQDPQTGRMIGDCFRRDHFLFGPDPRRNGGSHIFCFEPRLRPIRSGTLPVICIGTSASSQAL
jgi:hypothetical protein